MSMISLQVDELEILQKTLRQSGNLSAADKVREGIVTIQLLSEKLHKENIRRSDAYYNHASRLLNEDAVINCVTKAQITGSDFSVRELLSKLPSSYGYDWVPCDKRQPIVKDSYLVTTVNGTVCMETWYPNGGWAANVKPIAWMPKPESYREEN